MKTGKKLLALVLAAVLTLALGACSGKTVDNLSVWMIVKSTQSEFWKATFAGANAAAAEYNLELTIRGPETEEDHQTQNLYLAEALEAGADAVVLSAISYTGNAEAVAQLIQAGVKVVVIDSDVDCDGVSARIGTDNVQAGATACHVALNSGEEEINVGIINFDAGVRNGQEREQGFRQALYEDRRVHRIYTIHVLSTAEEAEQQTMDLLAAHPEINTLVSFNEPLTVGAARAVEKLGVQDRVRLVGFDTNLACIDMMQRDVISALMVQNPYAMGYLGAEAAWKLLNGETLPSSQLISTPTLVVTRENMFSIEIQKVLFPFV